MKQIPLTQGKFALVDDADFEWLNQWKWTYTAQGYAYRQDWGKRVNKKYPYRKTIYMHRLILGLTSRFQESDHINGDRLDNQRHNLRTCNSRQNKANQPKKKNSVWKYKGVNFQEKSGLWIARIRDNGRIKSLGCFQNAEDAATAYNFAAYELHGEFAYMNKAA